MVFYFNFQQAAFDDLKKEVKLSVSSVIRDIKLKRTIKAFGEIALISPPVAFSSGTNAHSLPRSRRNGLFMKNCFVVKHYASRKEFLSGY